MTRLQKIPLFGFAVTLGALVCFGCAPSAKATPTQYDYEIVETLPHDKNAFTQGLFFHDGYFFESTGLRGASTLRKVDIATGAVLKKNALPDALFGEGITFSKGHIVGITWRSQVGFVYDLETFEPKKKFTYPGEGWGITSDGDRLIMSDGTAELRILSLEDHAEIKRITVTHRGKKIPKLNELEFIDGEIYANIWQSDLIVRIDPATGVIRGVIDLRTLRREFEEEKGRAEALNGIAYDPETKRLWVTGKYWPNVFEIKLKPLGAPSAPKAN